MLTPSSPRPYSVTSRLGSYEKYQRSAIHTKQYCLYITMPSHITRVTVDLLTAARQHISWTSVLPLLAARQPSSPCQLPQTSQIHCWRCRLNELSRFTIILFSSASVTLAVCMLERLIIDHFWFQLRPTITVTAELMSVLNELLSSTNCPTSRRSCLYSTHVLTCLQRYKTSQAVTHTHTPVSSGQVAGCRTSFMTDANGYKMGIQSKSTEKWYSQGILQEDEIEKRFYNTPVTVQ